MTEAQPRPVNSFERVVLSGLLQLAMGWLGVTEGRNA
jgi:hypothetical protein